MTEGPDQAYGDRGAYLPQLHRNFFVFCILIFYYDILLL